MDSIPWVRCASGNVVYKCLVSPPNYQKESAVMHYSQTGLCIKVLHPIFHIFRNIVCGVKISCAPHDNFSCYVDRNCSTWKWNLHHMMKLSVMWSNFILSSNYDKLLKNSKMEQLAIAPCYKIIPQDKFAMWADFFVIYVVLAQCRNLGTFVWSKSELNILVSGTNMMHVRLW